MRTWLAEILEFFSTPLFSLFHFFFSYEPLAMLHNMYLNHVAVQGSIVSMHAAMDINLVEENLMIKNILREL